MSAVQWSAVRSAFATQIEGVTGSPTAARQPISVSNISAARGSLQYSIEITSRIVTGSERTRSQTDIGASVDTQVVVALASKIQVDAQVSTYDTGLDTCEEIIQAVAPLNTSTLLNGRLLFDRMTAALSLSGEWMIYTLAFNFRHLLALS